MEKTRAIDPLTPREAAVLKLLVEGLTDGAIALRLGIVTKSVATANREIYAKLRVRNRTEAVRYCLTSKGLIPVRDLRRVDGLPVGEDGKEKEGDRTDD